MNNVNHTLRELVLAGTASVAISAGTSAILYPVDYLYNADSAAPLRVTPDGSDQVKIAIDLGGGFADTVKAVHLRAANVENITANALLLESGAADPPVDWSALAALHGTAALDAMSDYLGYSSLYDVTWTPGRSDRYWLITLTQSNLIDAFVQLGELWFELAGDYAWWADDVRREDVRNFDWSGGELLVDQGLISGERAAAMVASLSSSLGEDELAASIEALRRTPYLGYVQQQFGEPSPIGYVERPPGRYYAMDRKIRRIWQTSNNDGKY